MWQRITVIVPTLLALALTTGACMIKPVAPAAEEPGEAVTQAAPDSVPAALSTIEADAEDIIDFAPQGDWARIPKDTTDMQAAWQLYLPQAAQDGAPQEVQSAMTAALEHLQTATKAQDAAATMQAANDVSAAVVELFALYASAIPADIGRLDVLGRQIILDVARDDWAKAEQTLAQTSEVWQRVKPSALEQKGDEAVAEYDASLAAQGDWLKAKDIEKLTSEATNGLEIVDALEQVYITTGQ